jgi:Holliday junction resolvase RusA-like endonuclease
MFIEINIKPLSVNECWQGKRYKTYEYQKYEKSVLLLLPKINLPKKPYSITFIFFVSNISADIDNPVKPFLDILQKKYGFNDRDVAELHVYKRRLKKVKEKIKFAISTSEIGFEKKQKNIFDR